MASVVQRGSTRPAPLPWSGQIAPKMEADAVLWSLGAEGLVPRLAQRRVILFFCPTRALSANQISRGLPLADRKSTRLNSSHANISYAVFCLKKKNLTQHIYGRP